ncbi:MAG: hypothetical protein I8H88_10150 [Burkholderiales bacterium]|nr:hypothetical protein [Burkholderiales bacterium]
MTSLARSPLLPLMLSALLGAAPAWASETAGTPATASQDLRIQAPLALDAARLMTMKPGERVQIDFPVIGRKSVVFESRTRGVDGLPYWHGRLADNARDRVFLKQTAAGFVGAVRFGDRQLALREQASGALIADPADPAGPSALSGQAYAMGAQLAPGVHELHSNFAAIARLQPGSEIALPLPGGLTEVAVVTRSGVDEHGFHQVVGVSRLEGLAHPVHLTISADAVFGSVITPRGDYQIQTRGGRVRLLDPRAAGLVPPRGEDHIELPASDAWLSAELPTAALPRRPVPGGGGGSSPDGSDPSSPPAPPAPPTPLPAGVVDTTIPLLMTYSSSFVTLWETELAARTRLSSLVESANSAYASSGTGVQFRIVGWRQIGVADDTPQTQLNNLRLDAGAFQGTAAQKTRQGAAMTVFFAPFNASTAATSTCGLAYVPAAYGAGLSVYRQQAPYLMFAALNDGQWNGAYCETLSLAHELGHNLGAVHDKPNASFQGVFDYSHGKGVPGAFGTVMAYVWPRVGLFSSPQLVCTADRLPCGTATENVVATVLQTKFTVAWLGRPDAPEADVGASRAVSGWLLRANGTPYTGEATLRATDARVSCRSGRTGLYTCRVPTGIHAVTLSASARGRSVTPTVTTFAVSHEAGAPTVATSFYIK